MKHEFDRVFDLGLCPQVLEHLYNPKKFVCKIFKVCKIAIISVPYKWGKGCCLDHIHDPIDEDKLFSWTGKVPVEKGSLGRPIIIMLKGCLQYIKINSWRIKLHRSKR